MGRNDATVAPMLSRRRWPLLAAIAILAIHGAIVLRAGAIVPPDGVTFSHRADQLIAGHLDSGATLRVFGPSNVPPVMYLFFVTLVALAKLVAGAAWPAVLVALNLLCDAAAAACLARLIELTTRSAAAVVLGIAFWLLCFDLVTWVRMPITDVPFLLASFAAVVSAMTRKSALLTIPLVVISVLLRPVGFLWLLFVAAAWLRIRPRALIAGTLMAGALLFAGHTIVVQHPERWAMGPLARSVRWDARSYQH